MSRILTEGFEYGIPAYTNSSGTSFRGTEWEYHQYIEGSYAIATNGVVTGGRTGNFAVRFREQHTGLKQQISSFATRSFTPCDELFCRIYLNLNGFTSPDADIIQILDTENGQLLKVRLLKSGKRFVVYNEANVSIGTLPPISANEWIKLEFHISVAASGSIEIRQNDALVLYHSGDTKGVKGSAGKLRIGASINRNDASTGDFQITFDDLAVNDTLGTFNNGWCGGGGVVGLKPTGAGSYTQFTPFGGTDNWENLTDTASSTDTSYNNSPTPGNIDTFVFEKLVDKGFMNLDTINSISIHMASRYFSEPANWAFYLKGVSEHEVGNFIAPTEFALYSILTDTDPEISDRFSVDKIDSMEFGYKHKAV